jgi:hypothetical protein
MWLKTISIPGGITRPPDKPPGSGKKDKSKNDKKKKPDNK